MDGENIKEKKVMLIRTQNKEALIDTLGLTIKLSQKSSAGKNTIIAYSNHCGVEGWENLGTYSSKEKAMKVLDIIQSKYCNANIWNTQSGFVKNITFNMPEDTEV